MTQAATQTHTRRPPNPGLVSEQPAPQNLPVVHNGAMLEPEAQQVDSRGSDAPTSYPRNIAAALVRITRNVGGVAKLGRNTFHQYDYQKWEDILDRLAPMLAQAGLLIQQSEIGGGVTVGDTLVSITYEFTVIHESGEVWPDRPRWKAIARLKDNKGVYDDKAANKCHTQALKYFLINLFKIRTRDAAQDDADAEQRQPDSRRRPPDPGASPAGPHVVSTVGFNFKSWTDLFVTKIKAAKSIDEVLEWRRLNEKTVLQIQDEGSEAATALYRKIEDAVAVRLDALRPAPDTTPAADRDEALVTSGLDDGTTETWDDPPAEPPPATRPPTPAAEVGPLARTLLGEIANLATVKGCIDWAMAAETRRKLLKPAEDTAVENALIERRRAIVGTK